MQEYPKSPCIYHTSENITNFCKEKSCLMPLCPTCICSHMEMHIKEGKTNPKFDNINESFSLVSADIKKFNQKFDTSKGQLVNVERLVLGQKKTLSDLVYQIKCQIREMVETSFDDLQKQLIAEVDRQNQALGLHVPASLESLERGIEDISEKLRDMLFDLKTDRGLSTLITFNHQTKTSMEKYQESLSKQLKNNEEYEPVFNVNYAAINRVKHSLSQVITLKFNLPEELRKPSKVPTETSQPSSSSNLTVSVNQNPPCQILSQRGPTTKTPFSKTCMNSLRSSFGGNNEVFAANFNKSQNATIASISSKNQTNVLNPALISSTTLKHRGPAQVRKVELENRP